MPLNGSANPEQLALLRNALNECCTEIGVDTAEILVRDKSARRALYFFQSGVSSVDELKQALRSDRLM